jgi:hypothetical protein
MIVTLRRQTNWLLKEVDLYFLDVSNVYHILDVTCKTKIQLGRK